MQSSTNMHFLGIRNVDSAEVEWPIGTSASRKRSPSSRRRWSSCTETAWCRWCRRSPHKRTTCSRSARRGAAFRRTRTVGAWGRHDKRGPPAVAPAPAAAAAAGLGGRVRVREREIDTIAGSCMNRNRTETERVARNRFVQFKAGERNEKKI